MTKHYSSRLILDRATTERLSFVTAGNAARQRKPPTPAFSATAKLVTAILVRAGDKSRDDNDALNCPVEHSPA